MNKIEKQVEFLDRLIRATSENRIRWEAPRGEHFFRLKLSKFGYSIECRDEDDVPPFDFSIFRVQASGAVDPSPVEMWRWNFEGQGHPIDGRLIQLYQVAKSQVLGYSELVDGMLDDLSSFDGSL